MQFQDRALIDGPARITREGHFVARARVARANNVQDYAPHELGLPPKADGKPYRIFRPEAAVFAKDSLNTAVRRPIVIDHPAVDVTDANREELETGLTGGEILRDGETMVVPIVVTRKDAVAAIQSTHREFSWGYAADLDMTPGKFGDEAYDGSITPPVYNHLAMCRQARGGSDLRVTDSLTIIDERSSPPEKNMPKITIGDAKDVDLSDGAVALAVGALNATLSDAQTKVSALTADLATANTTIQTRDGTIAALTQQVADAKITPEKLQAMADARAKVIADAKIIGGDKLVTDGKTDAEIRKAAVTARMGDAAAALSDAAIEGAFAAYVAGGAQTTRHTAPNGTPVNLGDAKATLSQGRAAWLASKENAYRNEAAN
jgi:hypothetical protein